MRRSVSHFTREEEADRCLNGTEFSRGSVAALFVGFLAFVIGVPIVQHGIEIRDNIAKRAKWNPASGEPKPGLAPKVYDVFRLVPTVSQLGRVRSFWDAWNLIPSAESIEELESELKDDSVLSQALLSPAQSVLTARFGVGNEKAYVGRPGWLFYRPDVEYLTDGPFLDPERLRRRAHGKTAVQPDPVKGILDFNRQLERRGITLIVVPVPTKPMIEPDRLNASVAPDAAPQNSSFPKFKSRLEAAGVTVFDPTPTLLEFRRAGQDAYLETDTHWTPEAMTAVASELAKKIGPTVTPTGKPEIVTNLGDLADMLKLPKRQRVLEPQTVAITPITGGLREDSSILLLGDSFSNIYSLESMGWGANAGFGEQISMCLGERIDKIAINAGGAFSSRQALARQLVGVTNRLAKKRVVIYEFSMRDLAQGDWKIIDLPQLKGEEAPIEPRMDFHPVWESREEFQKSGRLRVRFVPPTSDCDVEVRDLSGRLIRSGAPTAEGIDWPLGQLPAGKYQVFFAGKSKRGWNVRPAMIEVVKIPDGEIKLNRTGMGEATAVYPTDWKVRIDVETTAGVHVRNGVGGRNGRFKWDGLDDAKKPAPTGEYRFVARRLDGPQTASATFRWIAKPIEAKPTTTELGIEGVIAARAVTPKPGSVPYKDCLIALQLNELSPTGGPVRGPNIIVYVWGMRDGKLVDGTYLVGRRMRFKLEKWSSAEAKVGGLNRIELESDESLGWPAFFGEKK